MFGIIVTVYFSRQYEGHPDDCEYVSIAALIESEY